MFSSTLIQVLLLASGTAVAAVKPDQAKPTQAPDIGGPLTRRQNEPVSTATAVDTQFYSVDNDGVTSFIGSNPSVLSTVTVTSDATVAIQTAQVGIFQGEVGADDEWSVVLAPALIDALKAEIDAITTDLAKRDEILGPADLQRAARQKIAGILAPPMAISVGGAILNSVLNGAAKTGFSAIIGTAINFGVKRIPGVAILSWVMKNYYDMFVTIHDPNYLKAIKVPLDRFKDVKECPATTPACNTCGGIDFVCTTGPSATCECSDNCPVDDPPNCDASDCQGEADEICTTGPNKDCQCRASVDSPDVDDAFPNTDIFTSTDQFFLSLEKPPPQACYDTGVSPADTVELFPLGPVLDRNQLLYKLREVICSNDCKTPDQFPWPAVALVKQNNAVDQACEISVAVEGGAEAYMFRDRSIANEQQHCWDTTETLINTCVQNSAREGWQNGAGLTPGFYQTGYRKLNADGTKHPALNENDALKAPPPPFQSICGKGDGPCQGNGCRGVSYICTEGTYRGCYCGYDSRFGTLPGPDHELQCTPDCCLSASTEWFTDMWCSANCGGMSVQYCPSQS